MYCEDVSWIEVARIQWVFTSGFFATISLLVAVSVVPQLRRLVAEISRLTSRCNPTSVQVGLAADREAVRRISYEYLGCPCLSSCQQYHSVSWSLSSSETGTARDTYCMWRRRSSWQCYSEFWPLFYNDCVHYIPETLRDYQLFKKQSIPCWSWSANKAAKTWRKLELHNVISLWAAVSRMCLANRKVKTAVLLFPLSGKDGYKRIDILRFNANALRWRHNTAKSSQIGCSLSTQKLINADSVGPQWR
jgi:hypothetical protein